MEQHHITLLVIENIKSTIKALIISALYINILILIFVRGWINKSIQIEKGDANKQIRQLLVTLVIIIMIEILGYIGVDIEKGKVQIPVSVILERKVTDAEKSKIESKLKEMDEIINYRYSDKMQKIKKMEQDFGGMDLSEYYENNIPPESYELTICYRYKEDVKKELERIEGIKKII